MLGLSRSILSGYSPSGELVALNRAFDLGISSTDNITNQSKPPLVLTVNSDIRASSVITVTMSGVTYVTETLSVADYNNAGWTNSVSALADGTYAVAGTIVNGGTTTRLGGFTYQVNTAISQPSITGSASATGASSFTVTFGATKPLTGDVLVLMLDGVQNATKTLGGGDLTSTTITSVSPPLGIHLFSCYVYRTTSFVFSPTSGTFSQTINIPSFITSTFGSELAHATAASATTFATMTIATGKVVALVTGGLGGAGITLTSVNAHIPNIAGDPTGTNMAVDVQHQYNDVGTSIVAICSLTNAGVNTTADIVATWSGSMGANGCITFTMSGTTTPTLDQTATNPTTTPSQNPTLTASITTHDGGAVFGFARWDGGTTSTWTGLTTNHFDYTTDSPNFSRMTRVDQNTPAATSFSVTWAPAPTSNGASLVLASYKP